jgi:hypothetical protein
MDREERAFEIPELSGEQDASPPLLRQPHRVERIAEVVAGRYRPAAHAGTVRHDAVPLERVDVVRLLVEEAPFEGADVPLPLLGIHRAALRYVEVVQDGIDVAAVVGVAAVSGLELVEIQIRIDHVPALKVGAELKIAGAEIPEILSGFLDLLAQARTSRDVSSRPSWNFTPRRSLSTYVRVSDETAHDSARSPTTRVPVLSNGSMRSRVL